MGALGEESEPVGLRACPDNEMCPGLPALTSTFPANPSHSTGVCGSAHSKPPTWPVFRAAQGVLRKERYLSCFRENSGNPLRAKQETKEFLEQESHVQKPLRMRIQSAGMSLWSLRGFQLAGQDYKEL